MFIVILSAALTVMIVVVLAPVVTNFAIQAKESTVDPADTTREIWIDDIDGMMGAF